MNEAAEMVPGVRELDHTADVGIEIVASSLEELFHRAAIGMMMIVHGDGEESDARSSSGGRRRSWATASPNDVRPAEELEDRRVELEARDLDVLLLKWLNEVMYIDSVEGLVYSFSSFDELGDGRLSATVRGLRDTSPPVRELKGVTYHGLAVTRDNAGWRAHVIFDI